MDFLKEAHRATLKTNTYINDNGDSLIDLLLLLVTPLIAIDVLRQLFSYGSPIWIGMSFFYICIFMLIPTLWLRSTVESIDPDRDFISYLGSSKTYLTTLILILVTITFIKIPDISAFIDAVSQKQFQNTFKYTEGLLFITATLTCLRLSFLIPLYISGLNLSYKQALEATKGKTLALATTIFTSAFPLILFTGAYIFFIVPWLAGNIFSEMSSKIITMILLAPAKYLAIPLILVYSFTALAYHYANYAKQYLVTHKVAMKADKEDSDETKIDETKH